MDHLCLMFTINPYWSVDMCLNTSHHNFCCFPSYNCYSTPVRRVASFFHLGYSEIELPLHKKEIIWHFLTYSQPPPFSSIKLILMITSFRVRIEGHPSCKLSMTGAVALQCILANLERHKRSTKFWTSQTWIYVFHRQLVTQERVEHLFQNSQHYANPLSCSWIQQRLLYQHPPCPTASVFCWISVCLEPVIWLHFVEHDMLHGLFQPTT